MKPHQKKFIFENYKNKSSKAIAQELDMSERAVRRFIQSVAPQTSGDRGFLSGKISGGWIFAVLSLLGSVIYSNTFHATFQLDDIELIVENPYIRNFFDIPAVFNTFTTRFLTGWTLALNYAIGKLDVCGYHIFNITIHVISSWLVFGLAGLILDDMPLEKRPSTRQKNLFAVFSALLFLCHPIQTEGVTYIWERATSLAAFFI